jgi:hypothetical protein
MYEIKQGDDYYGDGSVWRIFFNQDFVCECTSELTAYLLMKHLKETMFCESKTGGCYNG